MLEKIVGNAAVIQAIQAALSTGRLSHSILLIGEQGTGTGFAARSLAADYLAPNGGAAANRVMKGQSEDCLEVFGEGASGEIKIDRIREIRRNIFSTSLSSSGRVVIIYQAQHFNSSSANALLKVLEEPPEGVIFILTASSAAAVLPTIRSRCIAFSFSPVTNTECVQYLHQQRPECRNAEFLAEVFGGKIGSALACTDDPIRKSILDDALRLASFASKGATYNSMVLLSSREGDKPAAKILLEDLQGICSATLRGCSVSELSAQQAAYILPIAQQAHQKLTANVNAKLVFAWMAAKLRQS